MTSNWCSEKWNLVSRAGLLEN